MKRITPVLIALSVFAIPQAPAAQPGCPDPQATNFNPSATSNDGSCLYPIMTYTPVFKANLPNDLQEISGLSKADSKWWGHADSGSDETFFSLDPESGDILQEVKLNNAHNRDWEDIAADGQHLYLGDFGNNLNDRQNLGIYKIPLSDIGNSNSETVQDDEWAFIPFAYADQTDFSPQPEDSSVYDCEAMIFFNQKIHLFTKSRRDYTSAHYAVNTATGLAEKAETFDSEGLITGASLSPDGKLVALVGYDLRPFIPTVFCWLLWDWQAGTDLFFSGNKRRVELGSALQVGQVESIGFDTDRAGYLSNERTTFNGVTLVGESVRSFDFSAWVPTSVGTGEPGGTLAEGSVFPNPFSNAVRFQFSGNKKPDFLQVKNQVGQTVLRLNEMPEMLDLGFLPSGFYVFETWRDGRSVGVYRGVKCVGE
ncbi:MAG: hypothetical protein ACKVUS_13630 [Saprospiraceae bacterium]